MTDSDYMKNINLHEWKFSTYKRFLVGLHDTLPPIVMKPYDRQFMRMPMMGKEPTPENIRDEIDTARSLGIGG